MDDALSPSPDPEIRFNDLAFLPSTADKMTTSTSTNTNSNNQVLQQSIPVDSNYQFEDDYTTYYSAQSRFSFRSFFTRSSLVTKSTGKQSQNGATWRQAFHISLNSGFGAGAPRGERYVGVREGREKGGYLPSIKGVGRTGKGPAPVPASMLAALGLKRKNTLLADAKRQVKELIGEVTELDRRVAELERFEQFRLASMRIRRRLKDHRASVDGLRDGFVADFEWKDDFGKEKQEWFRMWIEQQGELMQWFEKDLEVTRTMMREYDELSEKDPGENWQGMSSVEFDEKVTEIKQQLARVTELSSRAPGGHGECQDVMVPTLHNFVAIEEDLEVHERRNNLKHSRELLRRYDIFSLLEKGVGELLEGPNQASELLYLDRRKAVASDFKEDYRTYLSTLTEDCKRKFSREQ